MSNRKYESYLEKLVKLVILTFLDQGEIIGKVSYLFPAAMVLNLLASDHPLYNQYNQYKLKSKVTVNYGAIKSIEVISKLDLPLFIGYPVTYPLLSELLKEPYDDVLISTPRQNLFKELL